MKLFHSPNSPFVRKVMVTAHELGLAGRIELVPTDVWGPEPALLDVNPLGQIPTLVTGEGEAITDSSVICEYLDGEHGGGRLLAAGGSARWRIRRIEALGNGLLNAAVIRVLELRRRPEGLRWPELLTRQHAAMERVCDRLEREAPAFGAEPDLGQVAVACALGYVDLRLAADRWRDGRPALADWFAGFAMRASFRHTAPPGAPTLLAGTAVQGAAS